MSVQMENRQTTPLTLAQDTPPSQGLNQESHPLPNGASIPLQTFQLPDFPAQASQLKDLTLISDIKPTDYSDLLASQLAPEAIPSSIPKGITSLNLELFSLGYPAPFLTRLGRALPNLKALTLYSQLIDGVGDGSRKDAGDFFNGVLVGKKENGGGLRELHLLDAFCRKGFLAGLGGILDELSSSSSSSDAKQQQASKCALRFLEISYTYRGHSDPDFLHRIPGDELPTMLVPSLIAVSLSLSAAPAQAGTGLSEDVPDDPADVDENGVLIPGKRPQGIIPLSPGNLGTVLLVEKLTGHGLVLKEDDDDDKPAFGPGPRNLKMLDCTLYTLSVEQVADILRSQKELGILSASVLLQASSDAKKSLLDAISVAGNELEAVEIVVVPDESWKNEGSTTSLSDSSFHEIFPSKSDIEDLSKKVWRLEGFKLTVLRADSFGSVKWTKSSDGKWQGGVVRGDEKDEDKKEA